MFKLRYKIDADDWEWVKDSNGNLIVFDTKSKAMDYGEELKDEYGKRLKALKIWSYNRGGQYASK